MNEKIRYIELKDVPDDSKFIAPNHPIKRNKKDVKEANMWWESLTDSQKCLIHEDYLECVE